MPATLDINVKLDMSGQLAKSAILRQVPRAFKRNATDWASQTVRHIKQSYKGGNVFRRPPKEIDQNLDHKVHVLGAELANIVIGTGGYIGKNQVVYARIQEEGGTTHPMVTPRMRKWAWAMYYKDFRGEIKGMGLRGTAKRGAFTTFGLTGNMYKSIALTKKSHLDVKLPARHWFSRPIDEMRPELDRMMMPAAVWDLASRLAGTYPAGE